MRRALAIAAILVLAAACAMDGEEQEAAQTPENEEVSLALGSVSDSVEGNVVTLPVTVEGVEIVKADGDTSGDTGHFHVFIDEDPVEVGETIARERGIVHSAENPIKIWGLEPGEHDFTVVLGNGAHERIHEGIEASTTVEVEGPSVHGSVPATIDEGESFDVELSAEGVEIAAPDGESSDDSGHYIVLVDPEAPPAAGAMIEPTKEAGNYHTADDSVTIEELETGEHTIWVVLADGTHKAFDPPVMDKLTVTVS